MEFVHKSKIFNIIFISIFLIFSFSCSDDDVNNPQETPPELPPIEALSMNYDNFPANSQLSKLTEKYSPLEINSKENWGWAAFNVLFWRSLTNAGMIVPVASFAASFDSDPQKLEDGRWLWTNEFTPFTGEKYTSSLYGEVEGEKIYWEMYVSKENEYEDFLWYSGESDLTAMEGTWIINKNPEDPTPWIGIEWNRNPGEKLGDIKYTNIVPNGEENGGYIYFNLTSDDDYNAFFEIYNKGGDNTISIKWNRTAKNGRIKDPLHFGDEEWHCWDTDLEDTECE